MPERAYARDRTYLLPPATDEWIPATHPVRFIALFVDELPPTVWEELELADAPDPRGAPRYAPELLLSVWLAGFTLGIRTTRKLEYACQYDLAFVWLAGGQRPDHHTLGRFYAEHREAMRGLLKQTVKLALAANLLDLALQAVDGTKLLANAARERSLTAAELAELEQRLEAEIAHLEAQQLGDADPPPPSLPAELATRTALRERVRTAQAQLAATGQAGKVNLTDPEARVMKTRQGLQPAYNAQAVVVPLDAARSGGPGRLILAAELSTDPDDHGQLLPLLTAARLADHPPPLTVADAGYHSGANLAGCAAAGYPVVMPDAEPPQRSRRGFSPDRFVYDPATDTYSCPQGTALTRRSTPRRRDGRLQRTYRADGRRCRGCALRAACIGPPRGGRVLQVSPHDQQLRQHRDWMATPAATEALGRRKGVIEGVFGAIKEQFGGRRLWGRGQRAGAAEWSLLAIGANLRTLARVWAAQLATAPEPPLGPGPKGGLTAS
jgi:transposase